MELKDIPSADLAELERFNRWNSTWWDDKRGTVTGLHSLSKITIPRLLNDLIVPGVIRRPQADSSKPLDGLRILDVGCGGGIQTEGIAKLGGTIVGIDLASELIKIAKEHAALDPNLTDLTYHFQSVEEHSVQNYELYDVVIASEVLDHVLDKEVFLESCVKCLKPGGRIFVSTYNKTWASYYYGIILPEYVYKRMEQGTHIFEKFISPEGTAAILQKYNCKTVDVAGYMYDAFSNTWFWSNYKSINYLLQAVKDKKN